MKDILGLVLFLIFGFIVIKIVMKIAYIVGDHFADLIKKIKDNDR